MGWENIGSPYVIISPTSGLILVYSGAPSASTLKIVIAAQGGSVYGVSYPAGITVYGTSDQANPGLSLPVNSPDLALNALINSYIVNPGVGTEYFGTQYFGPEMTGFPDAATVALFSNYQQGGSPASGNLDYFSTGGTQYTPLIWSNNGIYAIGTVVSQEPGQTVPTAEVWHNAMLSNSWTNAAGTCRYQQNNDNTLSIMGRLTVPAGAANPSTIFTLPAGWTPATTQPAYAIEHASSSPYATTAHAVLVNASGTVAIYGATTNPNTLEVNIRVPLN